MAAYGQMSFRTEPVNLDGKNIQGWQLYVEKLSMVHNSYNILHGGEKYPWTGTPKEKAEFSKASLHKRIYKFRLA